MPKTRLFEAIFLKAVQKHASIKKLVRKKVDMIIENPIAKETLGNHIFEKYVYDKEVEWDDFRTAVTNWEVANYLDIY